MQHAADSKNNALNPTVKKLGAVSFFADVSSEMLYPITPIFLTAVLGASVASVGLIEGVAEGVASLLKTYSGAWSDRIQKRKTFIWIGYLFAAVAKPLIGLASTWPEVMFARSFDRLGKGIRSSPRDALLADAVDPRHRGQAFGWHRAMDTMGAAVGPLAAIAYLHFAPEPSRLKWIYFLALIPGLLAVLIVFAVREPARSKTSVAPPARFSLAGLPRAFKQYFFTWTAFSLVNSSDVFLLLQAKRVGLSLVYVIALYVFYNLFYSLASPRLGRLSDDFGRKPVLVAGLGLFAAVYGLFGFADAAWQLWILFGAYGIYMAATDGVGKALAIDLVPPNQKATGLGVLGAATGVATIFASAVAGQLWDRIGPASTFLFGAIGAVAAMLALAMIPMRRPPSDASAS